MVAYTYNWKLRQECYEFKASFSYIVKLCCHCPQGGKKITRSPQSFNYKLVLNSWVNYKKL